MGTDMTGVASSHYELLAVAPDASAQEIRTAYWRRSLDAHPHNGGSPEEFRALHQAYLVLTDPHLRAAHDATLAGG